MALLQLQIRSAYYFLKQPNQNPLIKDTASVYPVTGDVLPLLPDPPSDDYFQYDEFLIDEEIDQGKKKSKFSLGDVLISPAMAGDMIEPNVDIAEPNVDIVEISSYEGNKLKGYVPNPEGSKSGVTIGSGLDLGNRNINDLKGLPENIITKLEPFLGLKGNEAVTKAGELNITKEEAKIINTFAHKQSLTKLKNKWKKDSGKSFSLLSKEQATVLASVAFQYGDLKTETPTFYRLALAGDWQGVYDELIDFKDNYPTRRKKEAAYLKKYLDNK